MVGGDVFVQRKPEQKRERHLEAMIGRVYIEGASRVASQVLGISCIIGGLPRGWRQD